MNFNTNKTESNNKFNSINFAKKRRGRPKKDEGIAKPSTKKRGRPRKEDAPKKRGRPKKEEAPKKRGRPPKKKV